MRYLLFLLPLSLSAQIVLTPSAPSVNEGATLSITSNKSVNFSVNGAGTLTCTTACTSTVFTAPASVINTNIRHGCPVQPVDSIFNTRVDNLPVSSNSSTFMGSMAAVLPTQNFTIDPSWGVENDTTSTATTTYVNHYTTTLNGVSFPNPARPNILRESGSLNNDTTTDHHWINVTHDNCTIYETYDDGIFGFKGACPTCTVGSSLKYTGSTYNVVTDPSGSTDAAGLPLLPLTMHASDVRNGLKHMSRFTMSTGYIYQGTFYWPATQPNGSNPCIIGYSGGIPITGTACVSNGSILRLTSSWVTAHLSGYSALAQNIINGWRQYGIIVSDNGLNLDVVVDTDVYQDPAVAAAVTEVNNTVPVSAWEVVDPSTLEVSAGSTEVNPGNAYVTPSTYSVLTAHDGTDPDVTVPIAVNPVSVGVQYPYLTVAAGSFASGYQFSTWVNGSATTTVTWARTSGTGSITSGGLYTPPASAGSISTDVLTGTSAADANATVQVVVTILPAQTPTNSIGVDVAGTGCTGTRVWLSDTSIPQRNQGSYATTDSPNWSVPNDACMWSSNLHAFGADISYGPFLVPNGNYQVTYYMGQPGGPNGTYGTSVGNNIYIGPVQLDANGAFGGIVNFGLLSNLNYAFRQPTTYTIPIKVTNNILTVSMRAMQPGTGPVQDPSLNGLLIAPDAGATTPHWSIDTQQQVSVIPGASQLSDCQYTAAQTTATTPDRPGTLQLHVVDWFTGTNSPTWSIVSGPGSVDSSGCYSAPATQTTTAPVKIQATDGTNTATVTLAVVGSTNYPSGEPLLLTAGKQLTVLDPNDTTHSYTTAFNMTAGDRLITWANEAYIPPRYGTQTTCADPCMITMDRINGPQFIWYEEVNSSGTSFSPKKLSVYPFIGSQQQPQCTTTLTMPIEVIGQSAEPGIYAGYVSPCYQFSITSPTSTNQAMLFRVVNAQFQLKPYDQKLAVSVNGGAFVNLTNSNTTQLDSEGGFAYTAWHGLGDPADGGEYQYNLPNGTLVNGTNTVQFRVNSTDGNSSGYRILAVNFLDTSKQYLLNQIAVSSNVATATPSTSHALNSGDTVFVYRAPGVRARFNGYRTLTSVSGTSTFSFAACGALAATSMDSQYCNSPNGTYIAPVSTAASAYVTNWPLVGSQSMYAVKAYIPATSFAYTDPTTQTAPAGGSASAGATLWASGQIFNAGAPAFAYKLNSHCADCHERNGRDLAYFHATNWVIGQRAYHHGLTHQNALDIEAFIRSKDAANAGAPQARLWSPVEQPCPGTDAQAIAWWDGGCGLDSKTTWDPDGLEYWSSANLTPTGSFNFRNIPINVQLQSWLKFLPIYHPKDAFPNFNWNGAQTVVDYNNAVTCANGGTTFAVYKGCGYFNSLQLDYETSIANALNPDVFNGQPQNMAGVAYPSIYQKAGNYSTFQWLMVKMWELENPVNEGYCDQMYADLFGASTNGYYSRCWSTQRLFFNWAPHISMEPSHTPWADYQPTNGNPPPSWNYITNSIYWQQAVNNMGNRQAQAAGPEDWPYFQAFTWYHAPQMLPTGGNQFLVPISAANASAENLTTGFNYGAQFMLIRGFAGYWGYNGRAQFAFLTSAQLTTLANDYAHALAGLLATGSNSFWDAYLNRTSDTCSGGTYPGNNGYYDINLGNNLCDYFAGGFPTLAHFVTGGTANSDIQSILTFTNAVVSRGNVTGWAGHNFSTDLNIGGTNFTWPDGLVWWVPNNVNP